MNKIVMSQRFPMSIEKVFERLSDHESFGLLIGANITRIKTSEDQNPNGVGSVRRIVPFPGGAFEETVTAFEPLSLIEYKVTKGSPIKHHKGTLVFTENDGETQLDYLIEFVPKLPLPGWGSVLSWVIRSPIEKGLAQFAKSGGE